MHRTGVVHGGEDAVELQFRVEPLLDLLDGLGEQRHPAQREELALQRHYDLVSGRQGVHGEQAERGLTVDHDVVVVGHQRLQGALERGLPGHLADELHLGRGEVDVAGQQVHVGDRGLEQDVVGRHAPLHEQVVDGEVQLHRVDPEADGERALRVEVDEQDPAPVLRERGAQVDGRRGLADAALLVAHRDDLRGAVVGQGARDREVRQRPSGRADALAALTRGVGREGGRVLRIGLVLGVGVVEVPLGHLGEVGEAVGVPAALVAGRGVHV